MTALLCALSFLSLPAWPAPLGAPVRSWHERLSAGTEESLADVSEEVRLGREVAARLPTDQLSLLLSDSDFRVRYAVAERIAEEELFPLLDDPEEPIRELARERIAAVPSLAARLKRPAPRLRLATTDTPDRVTDPENPQ